MIKFKTSQDLINFLNLSKNKATYLNVCEKNFNDIEYFSVELKHLTHNISTENINSIDSFLYNICYINVCFKIKDTIFTALCLREKKYLKRFKNKVNNYYLLYKLNKI